MSKIAPAVIALAALAASPAIAHVTLEKRQAPVGSYYKAVFAVPHGCAGWRRSSYACKSLKA